MAFYIYSLTSQAFPCATHTPGLSENDSPVDHSTASLDAYTEVKKTNTTGEPNPGLLSSMQTRYR